MLVLFYGDNIESTNLATIWSVAAKNTVGPIFAACNLMIERKVAEAFTALNMINGSLHWAALKTIPYILVYQNGWPIAFYNGERSVQSIIDYSLTLACKAEYHEPENLFGGMIVAEGDDLLMKGDTQYGISSNPFRKDSLGFTANENLRGYDRNDMVKAYGSPSERSEAAHNLANEQASRIGISRSVIPVTAASSSGDNLENTSLENPSLEPTNQINESRGVRALPPLSNRQNQPSGVNLPRIVAPSTIRPFELEPPPGSSFD